MDHGKQEGIEIARQAGEQSLQCLNAPRGRSNDDDAHGFSMRTSLTSSNPPDTQAFHGLQRNG